MTAQRKRVALLDYGLGNVHSAAKALEARTRALGSENAALRRELLALRAEVVAMRRTTVASHSHPTKRRSAAGESR